MPAGDSTGDTTFPREGVALAFYRQKKQWQGKSCSALSALSWGILSWSVGIVHARSNQHIGADRKEHVQCTSPQLPNLQICWKCVNWNFWRLITWPHLGDLSQKIRRCILNTRTSVLPNFKCLLRSMGILQILDNINACIFSTNIVLGNNKIILSWGEEGEEILRQTPGTQISALLIKVFSNWRQSYNDNCHANLQIGSAICLNSYQEPSMNCGWGN